MAITINGSGTITGISAGGLPDGSVTADDLASSLDLSGKTITNMNPSGVYLGGTGSANYLDDYEEGTWSPGVYSGTVAADTCRYTKIGERVTVSGRFTTFSNTTTSDHVVITNLPFATRSAQYATGSMMINNTSTTKTVIPYCGGSATNISMYNSYNSSGWDNFVHAELNSNTVLYFSITYMAA